VDWTPWLAYPPGLRYQGLCGNCWVWAPTTAAEASLGAAGFRDALSVQYFMSAFGDPYPCCGGELAQFAGFYELKRAFVSLRNRGADFQDSDRNCASGGSAVPEAKVARAIRYPCSGLEPQRVRTFDVAPAEAIASLKNLLNQGRTVLWTFYLADEDAYGGFVAFWFSQGEAVLWRPERPRGRPYGDGGGHMVAIVGYDDDVWVDLNNDGFLDIAMMGMTGAAGSAADNVAAGSEQLSTAAQQVSEGSTEQAAAAATPAGRTTSLGTVASPASWNSSTSGATSDAAILAGAASSSLTTLMTNSPVSSTLRRVSFLISGRVPGAPCTAARTVGQNITVGGLEPTPEKKLKALNIPGRLNS